MGDLPGGEKERGYPLFALRQGTTPSPTLKYERGYGGVTTPPSGLDRGGGGPPLHFRTGYHLFLIKNGRE